MEIKQWYRRSLPHLQPLDGTFNICFRLNGSLPKFKIKELQQEREIKLELLEKQSFHITTNMFKQELVKINDRYFGKFDQLLDSPNSGPTFLKNEKVANIVKDALHFWDGKKLRLICYCIMPNHVHLLIDSCSDQLFKILKSIKRYSGTQANKYLEKQGTPFWQKESYDNLVTDQADLISKINYFLNNPVKAKLAYTWSDWPFTYLNPEFESLLKDKK